MALSSEHKKMLHQVFHVGLVVFQTVVDHLIQSGSFDITNIANYVILAMFVVRWFVLDLKAGFLQRHLLYRSLSDFFMLVD